MRGLQRGLVKTFLEGSQVHQGWRPTTVPGCTLVEEDADRKVGFTQTCEQGRSVTCAGLLVPHSREVSRHTLPCTSCHSPRCSLEPQTPLQIPRHALHHRFVRGACELGTGCHAMVPTPKWPSHASTQPCMSPHTLPWASCHSLTP